MARTAAAQAEFSHPGFSSAPIGDAGDDQGWNGELGERWAADLHRQEAAVRALTPRLLAAAQIGPGHRVLDLCCGGGGTTLLAAALAQRGSALGMDVSRPLIAVARARAAAERVSNAAFHCADAAGYPFPPAGYDRVISQFGLMFLPDPPRAFANLARALRPGGRLAFLCWQAAADNEFLTVPLRTVAPRAPVPGPADPDLPGPFALAEPERIRALLEGAQLGEAEVTGVRVPMWIGHNAADAVDHLLAGPMGRSLLAAADLAGEAAAGRALTEALAPRRGEDGIELGCAAWLVTAQRER